jgi:hypothetical protein
MLPEPCCRFFSGYSRGDVKRETKERVAGELSPHFEAAQTPLVSDE